MSKNNQPKQKFITKQTKANGDQEIIVHGNPSKTWWGKVCIVILAGAMVLIPIISLIVTLFS